MTLAGSDDGSVFNWSATTGTGVQSVAVTAGQGTATATFTVTVGATYVGTATFTASLSDNVNPAATQTVNIAVTLPPLAPPDAPAALTAAGGSGHVLLGWTAAASGSTATGYNVKRSTTSGGPYTLVATRTTTSYDDTTAVNDTTYYYVVTATNSAGESGNSNEGSATPHAIQVVISQVYGGGGAASGATYKYDYIELFNRGNYTANIGGYSLQYASGIGGSSPDFATANVFVIPSGTSIAPGKYLLVQSGTAGTAGIDFPVAADLSAGLFLGAGSGKVALANIGSALNCGSAIPCVLPDSRIVDLVSYGNSTNAEGGATVNSGVALVNTQGAVRKYGGCQDTDNNRDDFDVVTAPTPRNSASTANLCGVPNAAPTIVAPSNPITIVAQDSAPFTVILSGNDDGGIYVWSAATGNGVASVGVTGGQSTNAVTYTVTLKAGFYGTATFMATLSDGINPATLQTVNINVTPTPGVDNPPLIVPPPDPIVTVNQNPAPFTVNLVGTDDHNLYQWSATPGGGIDSVAITAGQGTATITCSVAVRAGYSGTASFNATLSDGVNPPVSTTVHIAVRLSGPHVVISQIYGGGGNSGATFTNDFVELFNPTTFPVDIAGWTIQYASAGGSFTQFQPIGGVIAPNEYYLVALAGNGAVGAPLPPANINGSINLSGSTGKVALVSNGDLLTGCTDPDVVDLVGYGSSASCWEGATYAPTPGTNAKALIRIGNVDTDQNGVDFASVTPNPRQTAPITEIGPSVVRTDPAAAETIAPFDANIIVSFTEPVFVDTGWYNIVCATSGLHNAGTVASTFGGTSWVIVPNVSFTAGENCTVTVFKNTVHDVDLDDSAPNTDTLAADYSWTFTVSTGAPPPYPPGVHLTMGNPSGAVADINTPNNYLMEKPQYAVSYNRDRGTPNWVSWHLASEWYGNITRVDTFRADPAVLPTWYRVLGSDFSGSGFDRGHMCPYADRDGVVPIEQATFLMSNMLPQSASNNQGPWEKFEAYLRTVADAGNELYIIAGPAGTGGIGTDGVVVNTIANGHVTVPASTWKVVMVLPKASGDDVARVTATTRTIAINIPNITDSTLAASDWTPYLTTVDAVEALTGYDFFSNVPPAIQAAIESGTDGVNPPGAASQTIAVTEDTAKAFTLDAVSTSGNPLTYTIVTQPAHGTLTGSAASWTYTPAVDFFGTDTFTWRVNDGVRDSGVATDTLSVAEVNDPPVAADDAKSTSSNATLIFAASDLLANDTSGPANESAQTLTVTAVNATAQTHGTVTLSNGQITYAPAANYTGPASFSYQVCDNGTTAGAIDNRCASATVNVTVATVTLAMSAPATVTANTPFAITVSARNATAIVSTYIGTVHFTSSAAGTLPADYTFSPADAGTHTFNITLSSTGTQTVTVSDGTTTASAVVSLSCSAPAPAGAISVTPNLCAKSTGNVATAPPGAAAYVWQLTNGTITSGQGGPSIAFTAGASGIVSLVVTTTTSLGCPGPTATGSSQIRPSPAATLPPTIAACAGAPVLIKATLTGTSPFTVVWSDGFKQTDVIGTTVYRQYATSVSATMRIASVTDASCSSSGPSAATQIMIEGTPVFAAVATEMTVHAGERATLTVSASPVTSYQWFQGEVGDESTLVGMGASFTSPPLQQTTKYWVKANSLCGHTRSPSFVVTIAAGRRRAAGH